jgi:CRP/FNR family cyclic AMP-dependent transcriptional regulator
MMWANDAFVTELTRENEGDDHVKLPNVFEKGSTPVMARPGDVIFAEGQPADFMYAVKSGEVELVIDGRVIETVGPDGFFGELALADREQRSATARAKTACELVPINEKQFLFMVGETPFFSLTVIRKLAERLRRRAPSSN